MNIPIPRGKKTTNSGVLFVLFIHETLMKQQHTAGKY